jgi:predicted ATPase/DNA-binding CsgD family transcriptional regulator
MIWLVAGYRRDGEVGAGRAPAEPWWARMAMSRSATTQPGTGGPAPLAVLPARRQVGGALPVPLSPLVGREPMVAAVRVLLEGEGVRLLTLTGPGGTGKTRLALAAAAEVDAAGAFADGVVFVALAALSDPADVPSAILTALGLADPPLQSASAALAAALRDRRVLLVLDNFEHVAAAGAAVASLLAACPAVAALVTSRERLRIGGERVLSVPPLTLPRPDDAPATVAASESVALLQVRAQAVDPTFALTEDEVAIAGELCRRLDGLPLAIELAAARLRVMSASDLLARLERRLPLLTGGDRDLPARQRTMRDAIAWSHDLLDPAEQAFLRRLAVFVGGFTLEAAESVGGVAFAAGGAVLDLLASLADKSLVRHDPAAPGGPRYVMIGTIREFATEQLRASGEEADVKTAHAAYFVAFANRAEVGLQSVAAALWMASFHAEHHNVLSALGWLERSDRWGELLQLATSSFRFWDRGLFWREGREWLERALDPRHSEAGPPTLRALAAHHLSVLLLRLGDYDAAERRLAEALSILEPIGSPSKIAGIYITRGAVAEYRGDEDSAWASYMAALPRYRADENQTGIAIALHDLADCAYRRGDHDQAADMATEAIAAARAGSNRAVLVDALLSFAQAAIARWDWPAAIAALHESVSVCRETGHVLGGIDTLAGLAALAAATGETGRAVRLLGAVAALGDPHGLTKLPHHVLHQRAIQTTRDALTDLEFTAGWRAGATLGYDEALAEGLAVTVVPTTTPAIPLSSREDQILQLLAADLSYREIADRLFLSVRTVERHVARLFAKLGVHSRAAAVETARAAGLLPAAPRTGSAATN